MIDWDELATFMKYNSVKEMLEKELGTTRESKFRGKHTMGSLAKKLGVSSVSLRFKLKELGVKGPPRGNRYPFFPERFGFKNEKEMFRYFHFVQNMTPRQMVEVLKTKIKEHPVELYTVTKRLTQHVFESKGREMRREL